MPLSSKQAVSSSSHAKDHSGLASGSLSDIQQSTALDDLDKAITQRTDKPAVKKVIISSDGGAIELFGCTLTVPSGALESKQEIVMSLTEAEVTKIPDSYVCLSPVLTFEPPIKFLKPVLIKIKAYCANIQEKIQVVHKYKRAEPWEIYCESLLSHNGLVSISIGGFCDFALIGKDTTSWKFSVCNDVFIHKNTAAIVALFFVGEKTPNDINQSLESKGYKSIMSLPYYQMCQFGDILQANMVCMSPMDKTVHPIGYDVVVCDENLLHKYKRLEFVLIPPLTKEKKSVISMKYDLKITNRLVPLEAPTQLTTDWPLPDAGTFEMVNVETSQTISILVMEGSVHSTNVSVTHIESILLNSNLKKE